jgi:ABC-2 type transport system ATP-binding protein
VSVVVSSERLSKWYGQVIALSNVSFTLGPGVTGLLGPNGAGKSTLMRLITGQLRPSQGGVTLWGEGAWNNPPLLRRIGFCPEPDAFYERMTGRRFVEALLELHGFSGGDVPALASAALETVGLQEAAGRKIGGYSKGMRQRIKLAQAIAHAPDLIVLDEPLAGMDPVARRETIRLVRRWGGEGRCVIVSSHILHEVEAMTRNILLIHQGQVVAEGEVSAIRDLIDKHPHRIFLRSSAPRLLGELLAACPDVCSLRFDDTGGLTVESQRPDAFYERLPDLLLRNEIELDELTSPDDNLEAVFHYLVQ